MGNITFVDHGDEINCAKMGSGGYAIPSIVEIKDYLDNLPKRPGMVRNLRHLFERGEVTEQELRTLHGVVTELSRGRVARGGPMAPDPGRVDPSIDG